MGEGRRIAHIMLMRNDGVGIGGGDRQFASNAKIRVRDDDSLFVYVYLRV